MKLVIGVVHGGFIHPSAAESLANLETPQNTEYRFQYGYQTDANRNSLVQYAKNANATHLLQIDADIAAERTAVSKILQLSRPFATGAYRRKDLSGWELFDEQRQQITQLEHKPFTVSACGMGFFLIDMNCLNTIPEPYYVNTWSLPERKRKTEDRYFCDRIASHGYSVWVEPSIELKHYTWNSV